MKPVTHRRAVVILAIAGTLDMVSGVIFSITQHVAVGDGLFWAVGTATTAGSGTVAAVNPAGKVLAVVVMLTVIPLFAAAFSLVTSGITGGHVKREAKVLHDCLDQVDTKVAHVIHYHPDIPDMPKETADAF